MRSVMIVRHTNQATCDCHEGSREVPKRRMKGFVQRGTNNIVILCRAREIPKRGPKGASPVICGVHPYLLNAYLPGSCIPPKM